MSEECIICRRVKPSFVFSLLHKIFDERVIDKSVIHEIGVEIIEIINLVDKKDRFFFCGKGKYSLLSGLIYLISRKYGSFLTQRDIWYGMNFEISTVCVRNSYQRWKKKLKMINYDFSRKGVWRIEL